MSTVIHLLNPAAGKGSLPDANALVGDVHVTSAQGDAEEYLKNRLSDDDCYRIYAYGGDGTLNETVNGILAADAGSRVTLTPMPTGSGNDFFRVSSECDTKTACDVIKYNDRYALNLLNIGFDCEVAARMSDYKRLPLVSGSFAYILGVAAEFIKKRPTYLRIAITDPDGNVEFLEDDYLLCAIANGRFYGGGFKAAPIADISDGILDVIIVKNIGRLRFLKLVGLYKKGDHISPDTRECIPELADVVTYRRAKSIKINGTFRYAADGEISSHESRELAIENVPGAISVASENYKEETEPVLI